MSVPKNRRKDASAKYITGARELRLITMRAVKRFPKSYRWIVTNNLLQLAGDVYINCVKANHIYVHPNMAEADFELRHRYLWIAETSADALLAEISFCYELVDDGQNFFKSAAEYDRIFSNWVEKGNETVKLIRAVRNSDNKKWKDWKDKTTG